MEGVVVENGCGESGWRKFMMENQLGFQMIQAFDVRIYVPEKNSENCGKYIWSKSSCDGYAILAEHRNHKKLTHQVMHALIVVNLDHDRVVHFELNRNSDYKCNNGTRFHELWNSPNEPGIGLGFNSETDALLAQKMILEIVQFHKQQGCFKTQNPSNPKEKFKNQSNCEHPVLQAYPVTVYPESTKAEKHSTGKLNQKNGCFSCFNDKNGSEVSKYSGNKDEETCLRCFPEQNKCGNNKNKNKKQSSGSCFPVSKTKQAKESQNPKKTQKNRCFPKKEVQRDSKSTNSGCFGKGSKKK
mmetsp:Transcript_262/g.461  ORF Transcript_262/g.461 Transcript_262/m.461 type:complete len:299 (-) Transcript_262:96-992(-)|eukprot:CAMPEP_0182448004 /NCGR_PEP_ID=MMETSP1172-20130603/22611_1 /TAXON_ID=708627 /ORGANISM="Timspurckia oligopyrenoides, Strain CCMP3278" /LENGTH=298 /DNA_ID=CAMNT_0024644695 /DNA_START=163 /DNA_END=1059 /DNA_ORIENTATION=+